MERGWDGGGMGGQGDRKLGSDSKSALMQGQYLSLCGYQHTTQGERGGGGVQDEELIRGAECHVCMGRIWKQDNMLIKRVGGPKSWLINMP